MNRYRVRSRAKQWNDKGPDLLRPRHKARRALATALVDKPPRMFVKINDGEWRETGGRAAVMDRFDDWKANEFSVGLRHDGRVDLFFAVRHEGVRDLDLGNSSPGTELVWSLIKHRFPKIIFAGAYVWKTTSPGNWSDHAWGTAVDGTENRDEGVTNDEVTDWIARMAAAGCINFDYALGSKDGRVVIVGGHGDMEPSGASSSHEWHNHVSVVDHDGRQPPRTGGVW